MRGSNPGVGEIFRTCPDRTWAHPNSCKMDTGFFSEGKEQPVRDADPSTPSSAVV